MKVGNIDTREKVLVVAEIGNNHEGSFENAQKLVRAAAACQVDAVKFQTFQTKWFTRNVDPARFKRLQGFELTQDEFAKLGELAKSLGLLFISTPLDLESGRFLAPIVDALKIASGDNDYWTLIEQAAKSKKPLIVSTGMATIDDVVKTHDFVAKHRALDDVAFLHCVSSYPAPPEQANLAGMTLLAEKLRCTVGYSDHTIGIEASLAAVALGARVIEKHFTLDKNFSEFRDHQLSADPDEMTRLVGHIRTVEKLVGKKEKRIQPCEEGIIPVARRSVAFAKELPRGHRLVDGDFTWLRPAGGLRPGEEQRLLGKTLTRDVAFGDAVTPNDVE